MNSKPKHIDQDAWDAVNSPELTDDEFARMKPARDVLKPALFEKLTKGRGPQKAPKKEAVALRLDRDVLKHFRAMGPGWQTKINEALREKVKAQGASPAKKKASAPHTASAVKSVAGSALTQPPDKAKTSKAAASSVHRPKKRA